MFIDCLCFTTVLDPHPGFIRDFAFRLYINAYLEKGSNLISATIFTVKKFRIHFRSLLDESIMRWFALIIVCITITISSPQKTQQRPNIIFVLTDDQDEQLHSMDYMPIVNKLIDQQGVRFKNSFVTTPICCPSRSSILTGQYVHNTQVFNNSIEGDCGSYRWQANHEKTQTFAVPLQKSGYTTFYAGKYMNNYGFDSTGGVGRVPPGWDWWTGLEGNSVYYNYTLSVNGTAEEHGDDLSDYLTKVIEKTALDFLKQGPSDKPFFMMLATPASHLPFQYEPQFTSDFAGWQAPRLPSFNHYSPDKHWLIRSQPKELSKLVQLLIDHQYRDRLRTLLTVDNMIGKIVDQLQQQQQLDNTFLIYASDNGFHLGEFNHPWDKRLPYEFDIRVPLAVMGPGISQGLVRHEPVLNIDLAPTILDIAGVDPLEHADGQSLKPLFSEPEVGASDPEWREYFAIEYWGIYGPHLASPACNYTKNDRVALCVVDCQCIDAGNNTYSCLRHIKPADGSVGNYVNLADEIYCEFKDDENFVEYYNILEDPYQLNNTAPQLSASKRAALHNKLAALFGCKGEECRTLGSTDNPSEEQNRKAIFAGQAAFAQLKSAQVLQAQTRKSGLSVEAIGGIALAVAAVLIVVGATIYRKRKGAAKNDSETRPILKKQTM